MKTYKFKPHVYLAPYAPYYDAYKGHTFKIDHYMEEDTMRKHVWLTGPVPVNGYVDLDDLEEVMDQREYEIAATKQAAKLRELFTPDTSSFDAKDWVILRLLRAIVRTEGHSETARHPDFANSILFLYKSHGIYALGQALKLLYEEEKVSG